MAVDLEYSDDDLHDYAMQDGPAAVDTLAMTSEEALEEEITTYLSGGKDGGSVCRSNEGSLRWWKVWLSCPDANHAPVDSDVRRSTSPCFRLLLAWRGTT